MRITKAANRYAKSLLDLAVEKNQLEEIRNDMETVANALKGSRELHVLVESKVINDDRKERALTSVFQGNVTDLTLQFFHLLTRHQRANLIPQICREFQQQYLDHKHILIVDVTSAVRLSQAALDKIRQTLHTSEWNEVRLNEHLDPELIGGFVIKTNNYLFDASVESQLNTLKRELVTTSHIAQI
ncbi:MAG: ATP synthase F1 subunit delta [Leptolyngbya sp. SIO3F4]|nr:ATP synthase F1 subunit delta [Leptolyngbya sp. SIO3F4]